MKTYPLTAYRKGGKYLIPQNTFNTGEFDREHNDLCLQEIIETDRFGHTQAKYRLFSRDFMRYTDTLEYDIRCPKCSNTLRLCGLPLDANNHGLYKCRNCSK